MTATPRRGPTASAPHPKNTDLSDFSNGWRALVKKQLGQQIQHKLMINSWKLHVKNVMNEELGAVEVVADAIGEFAVFFVGGIRREVHILGDVLAQVDDGTPVKPLDWVHDDHQGVVEGMSIGVIGRHRQGVAVDVHRLVVAA